MEWITRLRFNEQGHIDLTGRTWSNSGVTFATQGKFDGKAAYFNGSSMLLSATDVQADLGTWDLTLSFWFKGETLNAMAPHIIGSKWSSYSQIQGSYSFIM